MPRRRPTLLMHRARRVLGFSVGPLVLAVPGEQGMVRKLAISPSTVETSGVSQSREVEAGVAARVADLDLQGTARHGTDWRRPPRGSSRSTQRYPTRRNAGRNRGCALSGPPLRCLQCWPQAVLPGERLSRGTANPDDDPSKCLRPALETPARCSGGASTGSRPLPWLARPWGSSGVGWAWASSPSSALESSCRQP